MEERSRPRSRRLFLSKALAAAAFWKSSSAKPTLARPSDSERERLYRLLAEYGSELGDLRTPGRRD
ncbi:MAG TPA: hypothetical protein VIE88_09220 [Vicinamibacteria bacterium]|jgi:hypothetical protein